MGFEPENKNITNALKNNPVIADQMHKNNVKNEKSVFAIPKVNEEKTKTYTFTMKPEVRKRLSELSKSHGFRSDSSFLSFLIDHVE
ncbi:hypothetical protein [Lactobacillus amylovorus]|uniref:hypothetical protein n=1 Tax=Lactobacillus amylovorus TaxID=1604 RepID=UPI000E4DA30B|nr:hypothetical protein [Lactobacillus amylovorus]RGW84961.1 hypothetical protein DWV49_05405 [Lactobacillus amylovorus]